jgi:hypothetical protein
LERGRPGFPPDSSCLVVLTIPSRAALLRLPGSHRLWRPLPGSFDSEDTCSLAGESVASPDGPFNPLLASADRPPSQEGLGSSRFARHYSGNLVLISVREVLRCFRSPLRPPRVWVVRLPARGFPIRTSAALRVVGPSPRLLAAVLRPSSAPQRQGIHRPLSLACVRRALALAISRTPHLAVHLVTCTTPCGPQQPAPAGRGVEMRGFEPPPSSVQGRRSPC